MRELYWMFFSQNSKKMRRCMPSLLVFVGFFEPFGPPHDYYELLTKAAFVIFPFNWTQK